MTRHRSRHASPARPSERESGGNVGAAHLTAEQREELLVALEILRDRLLRLRDERQAQSEPVEGGDVADVAEGVIEDRVHGSLEEHDRVLLEEVLHALAKTDAGTYGLSELSGKPIPYARLHAVPWARYDSDEAERVERTARPLA